MKDKIACHRGRPSIFRRGLKEILESDAKYIVAAEFGDGESAIQQIKSINRTWRWGSQFAEDQRPGSVRAVCALPHPPVVGADDAADEGTFNAAMDAGRKGTWSGKCCQ